MTRQHIPWDTLSPGCHRLPCPHCSGSRSKDDALSVKIDPDYSGVAYCHRCHFTENKTAKMGGSPRLINAPSRSLIRSAPAQMLDVLDPSGQALSRKTLPIVEGTAAAAYLQARRCMLPPEDSDLRYLASHLHPGGYRGPFLVALLTDPLSGQARSLHFTWIDGGRKADVEKPRLNLSGHRKGHAICRLWPDSAVTDTLGIAEGLETALSLAHAVQPVWACMDSGGVRKFPVREGLTHLVIACDRDPGGEAAADHCAKTYAAAGVHTWVSRQSCNDLNDVLTQGSK